MSAPRDGGRELGALTEFGKHRSPGLGLPTSPHIPRLGLWGGLGPPCLLRMRLGVCCAWGAGQGPAFLDPPGHKEGKARSGLPHPFSPSSNAVDPLKSPSDVML